VRVVVERKDTTFREGYAMKLHEHMAQRKAGTRGKSSVCPAASADATLLSRRIDGRNDARIQATA
jgi:hypothetical protein